MQVVGTASSLGAAVELLDRHRPDVVFLNIGMSELDTADGLAFIGALPAATRLIAISERYSGALAYRAIKAGAMGYLSKGASRELLVQAAKLASLGSAVVDSGALLAFAEMSDSARSTPPGEDDAARLSRLSERERQVVSFLGKGLTNKEIARRLNYSVGTIKNVVQSIIRKLDVCDRTQAAVYAARCGLEV